MTNKEFLSGVVSVEELSGLARAKARPYITKTVDPALREQMVADGWTVDKHNKKTVRITKPKSHGHTLEDRVWILLHRMGFEFLSSDSGAHLLLDPKNPETPKTQIDVCAIDQEVAIAIECKSSEKSSKRPLFQQELGKHSLIRERFAAALKTQFDGPHKRQLVLAMFLSNIELSLNDRERAKEANILIFDQADLLYYESLVEHLGPAAKYQLLAEMLPGKAISGLAIRIPAIKSKMGGFNCYTFSLAPDYLLKISYVSHRSKGRASDVTTYQRMLNKNRLQKIQEYISKDGIFPTNIVINFERNRLQFEKIHQESTSDSGVCGWLDIRPAYKSAWVIDGQHRLYAYSGHERAEKGRLSILAFEGLAPSEQARLFIDINAKQKSVRQSLLQELYAELHWNSEEPKIQVRAIISRAVQETDRDPESPFYQRIQMADSDRDEIRCISLASVFGALERGDLFIAKEKDGSVLEFGPLWAGDDPNNTLRRTKYILNEWFRTIRLATNDWWSRGAGEGGGLAMNDGVIACINVLRSVFKHLEHKRLIRLDDTDLFEMIKKYASAVSEYLGSLSEPQRQAFRELRGGQGQIRRTRMCQAAMRIKLQDFDPPGLDDYLEEAKNQTNARAKQISDDIERMLQKVVLEELRRECGDDETGWWLIGVPKAVRVNVSKKYEEDGGKRGGKEYYFDLLDYMKIAEDNWEIFEPILAHGKSGNKDKRLSWIVFVNEKRNIVAHPSAGVTLAAEDVSQLDEYRSWLSDNLKKSGASVRPRSELSG
jgi:DNA sulfur modification protein DndB